MYRHLLGNTLDVFSRNSKIFSQMLMIILKIDVTSLNSSLTMQRLDYCLDQLFPNLKFSLLLNNSISLLKQGENITINKIWITFD